jgi:septal ring factor EnvC (AmiA/AmiB activator)
MRIRDRHNLFRCALAFVAAACVSLAAPAGAWAQQSGAIDKQLKSQQDKLKAIEKEIKQHRAKSSELQKKETDVAKQLSYLDKEISLATKYLSGLKKREALLTQQIDSLRADLVVESDVLAREKDRLAKRLRQMYMQSAVENEWEFILGGENVAEKLRRYKFMRMIAERDADLVVEVSTRKQGLEREQAALTEALSEIAANRITQESETEKLKKSKDSRVAMLKKIRKDAATHKKAIADLEKSQEKLKDLIGDLERKRVSEKEPTGIPPGGFAGLKGRLKKPVDGPIIGTFGQSKHPRFGTVTFNNGIDIQASAGSPIRAVAAGRVEFVDWIEGYGNCIIVNHGGGYYTLYAHASEILVRADQDVTANSVIAEVGDTGSYDGYTCHFEVRKAKQALNPMEWLAR